MTERSDFYYKVMERVLLDYDPLRSRPMWAKMIALDLNTLDKVDEIKDLLEDTQFVLEVMGARRDLAAYAVEAIKRHLPKILEKQLSLLNSSDARTAFQAAKDLLDRAGTGAVSKIAFNSPAMYRKSIEGLLEDEPDASSPPAE